MKIKRSPIFLFGLLLLLALLFLTACRAEKVEQFAGVKQKKEIRQDGIEKKRPPEREKQPRAPLTGLPADGDIGRRVIGAMINNHPAARPQTGLTAADVVYEVLAEGWITRFLALYQSNMPKKIGPIRSARDYFVALSEGYHAIYVHHGWSPGAKAYIQAHEIDNLNGLYYDGTLFQRVDFRKAPHNSYITYEHIVKGAKMNDYALKDDVIPLSFYNKKEIRTLKGEKISAITIQFGNRYRVSFHYDDKYRAFVRYSDGEKTVDRLSGKPVIVENVFIIETQHEIIDAKGRRAIDLASGGEAYLLQRGKLRKVQWINKNGRLLPAESAFVRGKTWIVVVPEFPGLKEAVVVDFENER